MVHLIIFHFGFQEFNFVEILMTILIQIEFGQVVKNFVYNDFEAKQEAD